MQLLLNGTPMNLAGQLRVMPARAEHLDVTQTVSVVRRLLEKAQVHMALRRIPVLRLETLQGLATLDGLLVRNQPARVLGPDTARSWDAATRAEWLITSRTVEHS